MSKHINTKRIVSLLLFCSSIMSIGAVSVRADNKAEAICYPAGGGYVYCDYGMDMTKKNLTGSPEAESDKKWAGYREIYLGGTWKTASGQYEDGAAYNYNGLLIDKFTFELKAKSNANSPLICEADLYVDDGKTKYCTFQINEFCDELLFPMDDWESPPLDDEKLALFVQFGSEFVENSKSMLADLMAGSEAQQGCNCGSEYQYMSNSEVIEELVTKLQDASAAGLLDELPQEDFEGIISILLEEYEFALAEGEQAEATVTTQSGDNGADNIRIAKHEARCRIIGHDYYTGLPVTFCSYGRRIENTKIKDGEEISNIRILSFEEIYIGGTWTDGVYNYDGDFLGKFRKDFKYNDNADIFWKVEVGLCGSHLEFCTMRDMEYSDKSRTHEQCYGLGIAINGGPHPSPLPYPDCFGWNHYKNKYWRDYE